MTDRFSHTVATFLEVYVALALSDLDSVLTDRAASRTREMCESVDRLRSEGRGCYALHVADGELDDRCGSAVLALAPAHRTYDRLEAVGDDRLDRLIRHVESVFDGLQYGPDGSGVKGLIRFEGDGWRMREQSSEKVWTVSTAWGANTGVEFATLLAAHDDNRAGAFADEGRVPLDLILPDGPLRADEDYLAEQFFDVSTPDSATPLGWPHTLRLTALTTLDADGASDGE